MRHVSHPQGHCQVKNGTRDIDPRPIDKIIVKFMFLPFVCSRCQAGNKGKRAMGACITNKIISWHAMLRHKSLHKSSSAPRIYISHINMVQPARHLIIMYLLKSIFINKGSGTRDINPRSRPLHITFCHTMLTLKNLICFLYPVLYRTRLQYPVDIAAVANISRLHSPGAKGHASGRTINGKLHH